MDKMCQMRTFVTLVEQGSYTAAAAKLGASKSVVSNRVQRLEQELGVRLVSRNSRSVSITDTGRHYYQKCHEVIDQIAAIEMDLVGRHSDVSGQLRITAPQSFGIHFVVPICSDFARANPAVQLDIELSDKYLDLVDGNFDVGIRIGNLEDSSLVSRNLGALPLELVAAPEYFADRAMPAKPQQVVEYDCIFDSNRRFGLRWRFERGGGVETVKIKPRFTVNSPSGARLAALKGLGITSVFEFLVRDDIEKGRLVQVLPDYERPRVPVQAIFPHRPLMPSKTRAFIDYMCSQLGPAIVHAQPSSGELEQP